MDPREVAAIRRRLRREHARWRRQQTRRWRTPAELWLAAWRERRQIEFQNTVRPGMLAFPPDDPGHAAFFRRIGIEPRYVPVPRSLRVCFAVLRAFRQPVPRLVRVPDSHAGPDDDRDS